MRIRISHETTYAYNPSARWIIQNLRLTPRSFDSQYVSGWRVSVDVDGTLRHSEDSLGNVVHSFAYQKSVDRLVVSVVGEVETTDAIGVIRGAVETLPPQMFLRASALAQVNGALRDFTTAAIAGVADPLERLHLIMDELHKEMSFDPTAAPTRAGAGEAFALKKGGASDFAHAFIACAHWLDIPARFVSGYTVPEEGETAHGLFSWAEALAPGLGWVAFDPVHDLCANASYVRVAVGFDAMSAAPFRASHSGGDEAITTTMRIEQAQGQRQS